MGNITKYNKLIAAVVGIAVILFGPDFLNMTSDTATTTQMILGLLTAFGVYQAPNKV